MKKTAAYFFLFTYVIILCKPIGPVITDAIAHAFYYSQHIATVHYENGKMHVHKELMEKAGEESSSKDHCLIKKCQATDEYFSAGNELTTYRITSIKPSGITLPGVILNLSPRIITPPPRLM
ncbi:MAG: hypothetical protein ABIY51_05790 [Ferruginibacter sp.]